MQHGIYYAYWEHEWDGDYHYYIDKVSSLGFDILEIAAGPLPEYSDEELKELKKHAADKNIRLTVGYGPVPENNISSSDPAVRKHALEFYTDLFKRMEKIGATLIGGALYSCWPIDFSKPVDKKGDWERGIEGMAKLGRIAAECGIEVLGLESLNRFENHVINTSKECTAFVKSVRELEPKQSRLFHFGTLSMTDDNVKEATKRAIETAKNNGLIISFDPNLRPPLWKSLDDARNQIAYGLSQCDVLKISDNEIEFMTGTSDFDKGANILMERYPNIKLLNITAGADGSYSYYREIRAYVPSYLLGGTIDTTGAGDTFCGSVLNYLLDHDLENLSKENLIEMLQIANAAAYLVTTKKGAIRSMPDPKDVQKVVNNNYIRED